MILVSGKVGTFTGSMFGGFLLIQLVQAQGSHGDLLRVLLLLNVRSNAGWSLFKYN